VLHGIVVDVRHMREAGAIIANDMLPEAALPHGAFTGPPPFRCAALPCNGAREMRLQQTPARRKIRVARRQAPDAMHVIGQNNRRDRFERHTRFNISPRGSQIADTPHKKIA